MKICRPILVLLFVVFSLISNAQELDSLRSSNKVLERLELETSLSLFESQEFNAVPSGGLQVAVVAPFYNGGLRLGLGVGFSRQTFNYSFDWGQHRILGPTPAYSSQLDAYPFNLDLSVGTDFLRNSPMDLILNVGARMNVPAYGNYHFNYEFYTYPSDHSFQLRTTINPAVLCNLTFSFPINENSSLAIGYGFSYTFLPFRLKSNSESNGIYYRSELIPKEYDNRLEDNIVGIVTEQGLNYLDMLVLQLPSNIGGQHSFSIGYRYSFGIRKNK